MIKISITACLLVLLACSYEPSAITDSCVVDGVSMVLLKSGNESILTIKKDGIETRRQLKIAPPCYFIRSDKRIQAFSYKEKKTKVVMITGHLMEDEEKAYLGASQEMVCGQKAQGVLFRNDSVLLSKKVLTDGMFCKDYGLDEKDFWTLAHEK